MKKIIAGAIALFFAMAPLAHSQSTDYSLGASGWTNGPAGTTTYTGTQNLQAGPNAWAISPYTGSTMVGLTPTSPTASYNAMTTALGMSTDSANALAAEIAAQNPQGGGTITNTAWIYKDFPLAAATKFSMYWVYTSTDYVPFNDGSITTFVNTSGSNLGKINNILTQYILLGATNPGTGNYSTGSYGSTGWQIVNYEAVDAGTYRLGFASFNQGDMALSPVLYVNDGLGTVTKNGETFGAVAPNDPNMPTVGPSTPSAPTVVSTVSTDPNVVITTTNGTPTTSNFVIDSSTKNGKNLSVTKLITPVTATPYTITTVTTPQVIQTWSDNTTTTIADPNNTATTTTQTGTAYQFGQSTSETALASAVGLSELTKFKSFNPFLIDPLSTKDGGWITPSASYYKSTGSLRSGGIDLGFHKTVDNNSLGIAFRMDGSKSGGYINSKADATSYSGTVYGLTKQQYGWWKIAVGVNHNDYNSTVSVPQFGLINGTKMKQTNYYADIGAYAPGTLFGIRPLAGVVINNSVISDIHEHGSPLLSTAPATGSTVSTNPYVGGRYDFNNTVYFESKLLYDKDYKVVSSNRLGVKTDIYKDVSLELGAGFDRGSDYTGVVGTAGVKWKF